MGEEIRRDFGQIRRKYLLLLLTLCLAAAMAQPAAASQKKTQTIRVLLVGNSYTYKNNLDEILQKIGKSCNVQIIVKKLAKGAASWSHYADESSALGKEFRQKLKEESWDYVILQDKRSRPLTAADGMEQDAAKLCSLIRKAGAKPMLYMTWAPANGHRDYRKYRSLVSSRKAYQKKVTAVYKKIGKSTGAQVIPAGLAVLEAEESFPNLEFEASDGYHPNKRGSYVVACTMYSAMTGKSAYGKSTYTAGIAKRQAMQLQRIAWKNASQYILKSGKRSKN